MLFVTDKDKPDCTGIKIADEELVTVGNGWIITGVAFNSIKPVDTITIVIERKEIENERSNSEAE